MTVVLVAACAVLGLVVGSFLNVVIHRVPRGESIAGPSSRCPHCTSPVRPRDNVPVLSWVLLHGRCRDCGGRVSARYPVVELLTAAVFALLAVRFGASTVLPAFLYLGAVGVALALIDLEVHRLPNVLTYPSYAVGLVGLGLAALLGAGTSALVRAVLGMAALYAVYLLLVTVYPAGMGWGDVKLAGVLGLYTGWLGWGAWFVGLLAGFFLGGLSGIGLMVAGRAGRKTMIPFGPFMLLGALIAILVGPQVARGYLDYTIR